MYNIVIADDHPFVREGIKHIIEGVDDLIVVGEVSNGDELLHILKNDAEVDLVLLDISMPGRSGLEILHVIKQMYPRLEILIVSMFPEKKYAIRTLKSGASGYLTKESAPDELLKAIDKIRQGGRYVSVTLGEQLALNILDDTNKPPHDILSDRELEILCLIGRGKTVKNIAGELFLSINTVNTYRSRILKKLKLNNTIEIVKYAIEYNLIVP